MHEVDDAGRSLNERFARSKGAPIEWNGLNVHISFEQPLDRPVNVWIRDVRADPIAGPQSITVSVRKRGRKRLGVVYERRVTTKLAVLG